MKPHRVRITHNLVVNYDLTKKMEIFKPKMVTANELTRYFNYGLGILLLTYLLFTCRFHSDDYINFLRMITPDNMGEYVRQLQRFNVGEDCPVFDGCK